MTHAVEKNCTVCAFQEKNPSKQVVNFILEFSYSIKNEEYLETSAGAECSYMGSGWCV